MRKILVYIITFVFARGLFEVFWDCFSDKKKNEEEAKRTPSRTVALILPVFRDLLRV